MKARDVRSLRYCDQCSRLAYKSDFLESGHTCIACAYEQAGGLDHFMIAYTQIEWEKLSLALVGVAGMRRLLRALRPTPAAVERVAQGLYAAINVTPWDDARAIVHDLYAYLARAAIAAMRGEEG